jgi:predicted dehydrogenase
MRIGIVGLGSIGLRHAENLHRLEQSVLGYDVAAKAWHLPRAASLAEFTRCEAVLICTPAHTHGRVARDLQAHGYSGPLFVEKPIACSRDDADVFATWPNRCTMVGYQSRFHPLLVGAKVEHAPLVGGCFRLACDMREWPGASYGSPLLECSHEIDLALWLGAPASVTHAEANGDRYTLTLGREWRVDIETRHEGYYRRWDAFSADNGFSFMFSNPWDVTDCGRVYISEMEHFIERVQRGEATRTPFADGLRALDVCAQVDAMTRQPA